MKVPHKVHLKDYCPPAFTVDSIELVLDIYADHTLVTATLQIERMTAGTHGIDLELCGESLELVSLAVAGSELANDSYTLSDDKLVIHGVSDFKTCVQIQNKIFPDRNTNLEGFYRSGEIYCTQCEPEGFRKITYYLDRPDVMAKFATTLIADKKRYPHLLSNGNRMAQGDLPEGRHYVKWVDPFRKPSYLFAAVAGDLEISKGSFVTKSGRMVAIEVYVDKGQGHKTAHAIRSLQNAMRWDEETFQLEYDLDIYMIVAVESFNFGAMENKGLNIFNSAYVLADEKTATDQDFQGIEAVVAHEYFHNWTGNRVTCRDWFQLTLKEGLTVFRDQEFSGDMLSRAVKRIEDVRRLKELQFPEDAGAMSHPIRPSSYIEINNFYTATVYEKGAEVIRMIHTLIGDNAFKNGMREYFRLYDGKAVTTEDFIFAMAQASGLDLEQFKNWYSRPGTPTLIVKSDYQSADQTFRLAIRQSYPTVMNERLERNVLHMPLKWALFSSSGEVLIDEHITELKELETEIVVQGVASRPVLSLNRGFTAPVIIDYAFTAEELYVLAAHDTDPVCRHDALQRLYSHAISQYVELLSHGGNLPTVLEPHFRQVLLRLQKDKSIDPAFKAYLFDLPTESQIHQTLSEAKIEAVHLALRHLESLLGNELREGWWELYHDYRDSLSGDLSAQAMGQRALKNRALSLLMKSHDPRRYQLLKTHFTEARCMTDESMGLQLYCQESSAEATAAIESFYQKWKHEPLVMVRWFAAQAMYVPPVKALELLKRLEQNESFRSQVPNDLRGLYQNFIRFNLVSFHASDGSGYDFIGATIRRIDQFNPQVAARLTGGFSLLPKLDAPRKILMKQSLQRLLEGRPSRDVFEVASKFISEV